MGYCGSGNRKDCWSNGWQYHDNRCCSIKNVKFGDSTEAYSWYGEWAECPSGYAVKSTCGSGSSARCTNSRNSNYYNRVQCVKVDLDFEALG